MFSNTDNLHAGGYMCPLDIPMQCPWWKNTFNLNGYTFDFYPPLFNNDPLMYFLLIIYHSLHILYIYTLLKATSLRFLIDGDDCGIFNWFNWHEPTWSHIFDLYKHVHRIYCTFSNRFSVPGGGGVGVEEIMGGITTNWGKKWRVGGSLLFQRLHFYDSRRCCFRQLPHISICRFHHSLFQPATQFPHRY